MDWHTLGTLAVWRKPVTRGKPVGRILLIHGINEHSGRHRNTVEFLTQRGYEVVHFDLRGCGHSGGRRQWIDAFQDYVDDTIQVYNWIHGHMDPLPLFVLGHSLGGAIAVHFAQGYHPELKGLILSAPAYRTGDSISPAVIALGRHLSRLFPFVPVPAKVTNWISRDPAVVRAYRVDPLCNHFNPLRQGAAVLKGLSEVPDKCAAITCPVLLVHGSADRVILLEGSFEILNSLGSKDRTLVIIPGGFHEPHNDLDRETYFTALEMWLRARS